MILEFLFYCFVVYLAYRLVFFFVLPILRTTLQIRKGFRTMHQQMNQAAGGNHQAQHTQASQQKNKPADPIGEYIDFEEV